MMTSYQKGLALVRALRQQMLDQTDYLLMPDNPISDDTEKFNELKSFRQALRDITSLLDDDDKINEVLSGGWDSSMTAPDFESPSYEKTYRFPDVPSWLNLSINTNKRELLPEIFAPKNNFPVQEIEDDVSDEVLPEEQITPRD